MSLSFPTRRSPVLMAAVAAASPEMRPDGFRIAEGSNGFQLVEHGIWRQPLAASSGAPVLEAGRTYLPYRYAKPEAGGPSGFRRASYLPPVYAAEAQYSLPSGLTIGRASCRERVCEYG